MGCNNSARLTFELQTVKQENEELQKQLKLANDIKDAFQQESAKAKLVVMNLTAENEKIAYELHVTKNSDYQNSSGIFESTKEEFLKMKQWTEMEIKKCNEILSSLLAHSGISKDDERHQHIIRIIDEIHDYEYDPVKLLELGRLRFRYIEDLLNEYIEFKSKLMIQLKAVEVTVTSALAKCSGLDSKELIAPLIQTPLISKLIIVRDLIKRIGFAGSEDLGMSDEHQRQLEAQVEELTSQVKLQEETIEMLRSARAGQPPSIEQARITELEGNLAAATSQLTQKTAEASALKSMVTELQDEVRMLQSKLKVLQDTSAGNTDVDTLRDTVATLTATGEKLVQEAEAARDRLLQNRQKASEAVVCAHKVQAHSEALDTLVKAVEELDALLAAD